MVTFLALAVWGWYLIGAALLLLAGFCFGAVYGAKTEKDVITQLLKLAQTETQAVAWIKGHLKL